MAVLHAQAGAHVVAPSGMMDGQVSAIRSALDAAGAIDTAILAYGAKYASAFYGPFREAVASSLVGDRKTYQQDPANIREALREVTLDVAEGADLIMVKPALGYLDVLRAVREAVDVPVAAYNVSGEYAMIEAAAANGWINRDAAVAETLTSIRRAGADVILDLLGARLGPATPRMSRDGNSAAAFARAQTVIPGGVNSPVRAFRSVGGSPRFIARAQGAYLYDVDGNELVDLVCSWGPMLLGHAHPEVLSAVARAASEGTSFGAPTVAEVDLAAEIVARPPSSRSGWSTPAPRRPCRCSAWPVASPAGTRSSSSPAATTGTWMHCSPPLVPASRRWVSPAHQASPRRRRPTRSS